MPRRLREVIDGDTGAALELEEQGAPLPHCFITRFDDDLLAVVLRHQAMLERVIGRKVSRAAAVRIALRRLLPKPRPKATREQLALFPGDKPRHRDLLTLVEADRVKEDAERRIR